MGLWAEAVPPGSLGQCRLLGGLTQIWHYPDWGPPLDGPALELDPLSNFIQAFS